MAHDEQDPAKARFFTMQTVRLLSAALAALGVVVVTGNLPAAPPIAGYLLLLAGLTGFFVVPTLLSRRWKSGR